MAEISDFFAVSNNASAMSFHPRKDEFKYVLSSGGKDSGQINNLARLLHGGKKKHKSLKQFCKNYQAIVDSSRDIKVVGHGNSGMFEIGDGEFGVSLEGRIDYGFNQFYWQDRIEELALLDRRPIHQRFGIVDGQITEIKRKVGMFDIWACCVAKGDYGLKFLHLLADYLNRPVRAFTGLIYVSKSGYSFERGHRHVTVQPKTTLNDQNVSRSSTGKVKIETSFITIEQHLKSKDFDFVTVIRTKGGKIIEKQFHADIASNIAIALIGSTPFASNGGVCGVATAIIQFTYKAKTQMKFTVFCDTFAQQHDSKLGFMVTSDFKPMMDIFFDD